MQAHFPRYLEPRLGLCAWIVLLVHGLEHDRQHALIVLLEPSQLLFVLHPALIVLHVVIQGGHLQARLFAKIV
jgi:hypothetical protein